MCGERIHLIGSISLSSPPVAGVWWAHPLDWLYNSLSSPPVAGVWWAYTLDWLYLSLLSTCSWCVVSTLAPLSCGSRHIIQVDTAHWWWLKRTPPPPPHIIVKCFGCTAIHNKALYKCIIHSFLCLFKTRITLKDLGQLWHSVLSYLFCSVPVSILIQFNICHYLVKNKKHENN